MAIRTESESSNILEQLEKLEAALAPVTHLSLTEAGAFLNKVPSVITQYAKAGLVQLIQQGPKKLVSMEDIHVLTALFYLAQRYNCSYVTCRLIKTILAELKIEPIKYLDFIKSMEKKANITDEEVSKHVNSYKNRGIFQKQKAGKST